MKISGHDSGVLQELGRKLVEISEDPVNQKRIRLWKRLNRRERVKPPVFIYEIPWHEMNVDGELTIRTEGVLCRDIEGMMRMTIYQWNHMQGDMVVEPVIYSPLAVKDSGFGITEDVDTSSTDKSSSVVSRHFNIQIRDEADIAKIKTPVIEYDAAKSNEIFGALSEVFDDIILVKKGGYRRLNFNAWDELVRWTGTQEALMDMALRPEYIHALMDRLTGAYIARLDQFDRYGLLRSNNDNSFGSSGGLGYTDMLPVKGDDEQVHPSDCWGRSMSQIFSEVSPEMHDEFALQYEMRWLKKFGVTYYGCCEQLHKKVGILRMIPHLKKISMSPWIDFEEAVENIGTDYVFSFKPNPAHLAWDQWNPGKVREYLEEKLEITRPCAVEIILKDISTVRYQPQRLWEWSRIACEVSERYA